MKKILLVLSFFLLLTNNLIFAAGNTLMLRKSDNISQDELNILAQQTTETLQKQTDGTITPFNNTEPQVFTVYGWFNQHDESIRSSSKAIITGGETRAMLGQPNSGETLETIKIYSRNTNLAFKYIAKLENEDWQGEQNGLYDLAQGAGNVTDQSRKIVNLKIALNGSNSAFYDVFYRVYLKNKGWSSWSANYNPVCPEESVDYIECLDVRVLPKGSAAPPDNIETQNIPLILVSAHIENMGTSKTTIGKNIEVGKENSQLGIEGLTLTTSNAQLNLSYQSYISGTGWQDSKTNNAFSGTKGEGKSIEAIKIKLEGAQAPNYDVYYRTYVQGYGWLDWANNDQISGTINQGLKIEALNIKILPKGSLLPGNAELPSVIAYDTQEGEFLKLVNMKRHEKGLLPISGIKLLHDAALVRTSELEAKYNHVRPNNTGFETILSDINYRADGLKPALGECFTKSTDVNKVFANFEKREICQNLLYTDYYRYGALVSNSSKEGVEPVTELLLTDIPNDYSYLY